MSNDLRPLLTQTMVDAAFEWLLKSSEEAAAAKAQKSRCEFKAKKVFARLVRHAEGAMELRKAFAQDSAEYEEAMERLFAAEEHWELLSDQGDRARVIIDTWRTIEASNRGLDRRAR